MSDSCWGKANIPDAIEVIVQYKWPSAHQNFWNNGIAMNWLSGTRLWLRARYKKSRYVPMPHEDSEREGRDQNKLSNPVPQTAEVLRCIRCHGRRSRAYHREHRQNPVLYPAAEQTSRKDRHSTRPYCTIACIRGIVSREPLDKKCPNWKLHGGQRHSIGPQEFTSQLHRQLARDRDLGFEPLHVCGRTGYLMKATLLSRGYTMLIKATTVEKQHHLQTEVDNYRRLRNLQGQHIPVCLGDFKPRVAYWYHGELMAQMMILSWSGTRLQHVINDGNSGFFHQERDKALAVLRSRGVIHGDSEWRNMLWDDLSDRLVVIDLEDVKWLKRPRALEPTSGNTRRNDCIGVRESKHGLKRMEICDMAVP